MTKTIKIKSRSLKREETMKELAIIFLAGFAGVLVASLIIKAVV